MSQALGHWESRNRSVFLIQEVRASERKQTDGYHAVHKYPKWLFTRGYHANTKEGPNQSYGKQSPTTTLCLRGCPCGGGPLGWEMIRPTPGFKSRTEG